MQVGLTMNYANAPSGGNFSKTLRTAVGRVSAATFDSGLFPASGDAQDIGLDGTRWKDLYVNTIDVSGTIAQGGNYDAAGRGYMIVGGQTNIGQTCTAICNSHDLLCTIGYSFQQCSADCLGNANDYLLRVLACGTPITLPAPGAFCICN